MTSTSDTDSLDLLEDGLRKTMLSTSGAELDAALARIQQNPQMYAAESGSIRVCPLHRFPYSVYYEELADRIWVAAVGHQSRRPGYWARRRPNGIRPN